MVGRISEREVEDLRADLAGILEPHGFEVQPFLVGWYDQQVAEKFHLGHQPDTLAFVVISQPSMFEKAFLPWLASAELDSIRDPIDQCMMHYFSLAQCRHPATEALHDFQLGPTRRPKVLVQTAGHVAAAARLYRAEDVPALADTTADSGKLFPVCHHPVWGGWFALRGVLVFREVRAELERREPGPALGGAEAEQLLRMYNGRWQDWRWRDVGRRPGTESLRYSDQQIRYFETPPADRGKIIQEMLREISTAGV
jgi:methylmalonic aciduria homocystinuria type C protein